MSAGPSSPSERAEWMRQMCCILGVETESAARCHQRIRAQATVREALDTGRITRAEASRMLTDLERQRGLANLRRWIDERAAAGFTVPASGTPALKADPAVVVARIRSWQGTARKA